MKDFLKKNHEIITYLFYGVGTTVANLIIYAVAVSLGMGITVSNAIAWFGAVVFAFVTNKLFVFESKSWAWRTTLSEAGKFLGARIFSGILEITLPTVLFWIGLNQSLFGVEGLVAKIIVSIFIIILNYILSKIIVFRKK